ncbi:hypothetical protein NLU13_8954 [Sarocladium strictum]|uniref:BZIP domain-containing protein n=1 Tax=Sarocladium strictum TaxID=5046 RepID=A0AA39GAD1_SARSR|nr:hypothetical protein NLU13_8954 [Sarocladium strictum]
MPNLAATLPGSPEAFFDAALGHSDMVSSAAAAAFEDSNLGFANCSQPEASNTDLASALMCHTEITAPDPSSSSSSSTLTTSRKTTTTKRRQTQPKVKEKQVKGRLSQQDAKPAKTEVKRRTRKAPKKPPATTVAKEYEEEEEEAQVVEVVEEGVDHDNRSPNLPAGNDGEHHHPALQSERHKIMERNRVAATKCRTRKRSETSRLASYEQEVEEKHRHLTAQRDALQHEAYVIKTQLLQHTNCECVLIQKYIASEAKKSVDKMTGGGGGSSSAGSGGGGGGGGEASIGTATATARSGEDGSISTPDWQVSTSSTSTVADSTKMQSPLTGLPGDGTMMAWTAGLMAAASSSSSSNAMPPQIVDAYPQTPSMMPYTPIPPEVSLDGFCPSHVVDLNAPPFLAPGGFPADMIWDAGWNMG